MIRQCVVGLLFLLVAVYSTPASKQILAEDPVYPLPTDITPVSYEITLNFADTAFTKDGTEFAGTAKLAFTVGSEKTVIKFHLAQSFITLTSLSFGDAILDPKDYSIDPNTDIVTIASTAVTVDPKTTCTLTAVYTGKFSSDGYGIYKGSYLNAKKETVYYLATQVSPIYARRIFPCFDEPGLKATFDVTVIYPNTASLTNLAVLFNTVQTKDPSSDATSKTIIFTTTESMSTYQFALVVSDFASSGDAASISADSTYQVWSRSDASASTAYAKSTGADILKQLNTYTATTYGKKLDQVALPDLNEAATDNWGLLSSRENLLLFDAKDSPISSKQTTTQYIANQIAHQWFGDKTTCSTWADLFLNEGLSAYMEYVIIDKLLPKWELPNQFILRALHPVLAYDSLETAPALTTAALSPQEIKDKFNIIATKKGGSVIRMVANVVGDAFQAGLPAYLKISSASNNDLWKSISDQIKTDSSPLPKDVALSDVMKNWLTQPGYPLVSVSLNGKTLTISQKRFLLNPDSTTADKDLKWYVPISYTESKGTDKFKTTSPSVWLTPSDENAQITKTLDNDNDWVVVNNLQTGYYRVNYDDTLWTKIATALKNKDFEGIVDVNRAQIVDDAFNIAKTGQLKFSKFLEIVQFLNDDTSYYPWVPAFDAFSYMLQRVPEGDLRTNIIEELTTLMTKFYATVSFDDVKEDPIPALTQELAFKHACLIGDKACTDKVTALFTAYKTKDEDTPNKNLRYVVYCNALRNSEDAAKDYTFLWGEYTKAVLPTEKATILSALGCSSDEGSLKTLLQEASKASGDIKSQDALAAFESVYSESSKGAGVAVDFLISNWADVVAKFTELSDRKSLITGIADKLTTADQVAKFKTLIEGKDFPADLKETSQSALAAAQANVDWYKNNQKDLEAYYNPGDGGGAANAIHVNIVLMTIVAIFSLLGVMTP